MYVNCNLINTQEMCLKMYKHRTVIIADNASDKSLIINNIINYV